MSENHRRPRQPQNQSSQGDDHSDRVLDELAATLPQASPAFQQALETQLVAVLQEQQQSVSKRSDLPMQMRAHDPMNDSNADTRFRLQVPLTLVAALTVVLAAGAILVLMNQRPPENEPDTAFGVVAQTTEEALRATLDALETQSAGLRASLEAEQRATVEQTLRAVEPTETPFPTSPSIMDATMAAAVQSCLLEPMRVYTSPDTASAVLIEIAPNLSIDIQGTLALNTTGEEWFLIGFPAENGDIVRGWVQADPIRMACPRLVVPEMVPTIVPVPLFATATPIMPDAPLQITLVPTVLPPGYIVTASPVFTPTFTATPSATHTLTPTITPTTTFTPTAIPLPAQANDINPVTSVQVRVADAETIDQAAFLGRMVDVFINAGSADTPVIVPVARGVIVLEFVEVPIPNETRYVFVNAVLMPRNNEQAELLAGLAETGIEMKLVLAG